MGDHQPWPVGGKNKNYYTEQTEFFLFITVGYLTCTPRSFSTGCTISVPHSHTTRADAKTRVHSGRTVTVLVDPRARDRARGKVAAPVQSECRSRGQNVGRLHSEWYASTVTPKISGMSNETVFMNMISVFTTWIYFIGFAILMLAIEDMYGYRIIISMLSVVLWIGR